MRSYNTQIGAIVIELMLRSWYLRMSQSLNLVALLLQLQSDGTYFLYSLTHPQSRLSTKGMA